MVTSPQATMVHSGPGQFQTNVRSHCRALMPMERLVLDVLYGKGSISRMEAAIVCKTGSLSKVISNLRHVHGYGIVSKWQRDSMGSKYKRYYLMYVSRRCRS